MSAPVQDAVPQFARGASFEAVVSLPVNVAENYFAEWQKLSQLRKEGDMTKQGLIADLDVKSIGPREFLISSNDTDKWPVGTAEFDILFSDRTGRRIRTKTIRVNIRSGVTQS